MAQARQKKKETRKKKGFSCPRQKKDVQNDSDEKQDENKKGYLEHQKDCPTKSVAFVHFRRNKNFPFRFVNVLV